MGGFGDYFSRRETYDRTNALAVVGPDAMPSPMTAGTVTALLDWYSDHLRVRQQVTVR